MQINLDSSSEIFAKAGVIRANIIRENGMPIVMASYYDLRNLTADEYVDFNDRLGNLLRDHNTGRLLLDTTLMKNFSISLRSAGVSNINRTIYSKVPWFLLGVIKSRSPFENLGMQAAISSARVVSKKFLDGRMFENRVEAEQWLRGFDTSKPFDDEGK
jgi:hypothetical protein